MVDSFKVIYKILNFLECSMDLSKTDITQISAKRLGISDSRWTRYMEMLFESGYIKGIAIEQYADGEKEIVNDDIRITLKGLEFLTQNSVMQRLYKAAKGIKNYPENLKF